MPPLVVCPGSGAVPRRTRWITSPRRAAKLYGECPACHRMIAVRRGSAEIMAHKNRAPKAEAEVKPATFHAPPGYLAAEALAAAEAEAETLGAEIDADTIIEPEGYDREGFFE